MKFIAAAIGAAALCTAAHGQFYTGFEATTYSGSAAGVSATGQNGWYQPVATGIGSNIHTYAGNVAGFGQNPVGGDQFMVGVSEGGSLFARSQRNINFGPGVWTVSYDMAAQFLGTGSSALNLSSFSLQHETTPAGQFKDFIALNNFVDLANPALGWKAEFNVFDAAGAPINNQSAGAAWQNLNVNHWYRQYITFDLTSNRILNITLLDLHTGLSSSAQPEWYVRGGAQSTLEMPGGVRFFVGGAAGNTMGWDNVHVIPAPGAFGLLAAGALFGMRRRRA